MGVLTAASLLLSALLLTAVPIPSSSAVSRRSPLRDVLPASPPAANAALPIVGLSFPRLLWGSNNTGNYTYCDLCSSLTGYIAPFVRDGTTVKVIEFLALAYCQVEELGKDCHSIPECYDLCTGIVSEFGPILINILANTSLSAQELCFDANLCPAPTPPIPGVPVPSNVSNMSGQKQWSMWSAMGSGTFVHLSDLHFDKLYAPGSSTECGLDLCCRSAWSVPGNTSGVAGLFGDYQCDSPAVLVESVFDFLNRTLTPRPDFILYTGDDPAHDIWHQNRTTNLAAIAWVCAALLRYFPDIPVLSAIGNHEAAPVNQFGGPGVDTWLYEALVLDWAYYLPDDAQQTLNYGGYYAALIRPGLYVLSINTNIYTSDDFYTKYNMVDLSSQMLWLNDTLMQIQQLGDSRCIIIGHSSPIDWYDLFADQFNALLSQYNQLVLNLFFGHTHHNQVQLYSDDSAKPAHTVGYIGGSVTPYTDVNPGVAVYSYDRSLSNSYLVSDIDYYWLNLTLANQQLSSDWSGAKLSARASYGLASLSPADWWKLAEGWVAGGGSAGVYESMQLAWYKGLYNGGAGSVADRQCFGCELESDTDTQMAACTARAGVQCGGNGMQRSARQQQQQQQADKCGSYTAEQIDAQRQKATQLEQLRAEWEQRTAAQNSASRSREMAREHRHVRRPTV